MRDYRIDDRRSSVHSLSGSVFYEGTSRNLSYLGYQPGFKVLDLKKDREINKNGMVHIV
ncbi:hypothetical protein [Methanolobus sp. WCC4]|uniref:hypothetical protein n=1 Tax=Methanolobus sp. WCC4 TaxID=3125784 RepID=UPI0030F5F7CD